jgi:hypothetical protein
VRLPVGERLTGVYSRRPTRHTVAMQHAVEKGTDAPLACKSCPYFCEYGQNSFGVVGGPDTPQGPPARRPTVVDRCGVTHANTGREPVRKQNKTSIALWRLWARIIMMLNHDCQAVDQALTKRCAVLPCAKRTSHEWTTCPFAYTLVSRPCCYGSTSRQTAFHTIKV